MRILVSGRAWRSSLVLAFVVIALGGCAHQPRSALPGAPGFFSGLLHGFLMLVSLVGSTFADVRVYAFPNSGFFYDLGFVIGAAAVLRGGPRMMRRLVEELPHLAGITCSGG